MLRFYCQRIIAIDRFFFWRTLERLLRNFTHLTKNVAFVVLGNYTLALTLCRRPPLPQLAMVAVSDLSTMGLVSRPRCPLSRTLLVLVHDLSHLRFPPPSVRAEGQ